MPKRPLHMTWLTALAATTALATLLTVPAATARAGGGRLLAQRPRLRHLPARRRRLVRRSGPPLRAAARRHLRVRTVLALALLPVGGRRSAPNPARQPRLHPRLPPGRTRRLVRRPGH